MFYKILSIFKRKKLPTGIPSDRRRQFRLSIGSKLISITSLNIIIALTTMTFLASYFFKSDNELRIKETNHKISDLTSQKVRSDLVTIVKMASLLAADLLEKNKNDDGDNGTSAKRFFSNNRDQIFICLAEKDGNGLPKIKASTSNREFLEKNRITDKDIKTAFTAEKKTFSRSFNTEDVISNISPMLRVPAIAMSIPFIKNTDTSASMILVVFFSMNRFIESVKSPGITKVFIVNNNGDLIAHHDTSLVSAKANFSKLPIVTMMQKSSVDNGQTRYDGGKGSFYVGSFKKIGFANSGVIATVQEDKAYEAVYQIQKRNILITIIVLVLAILVVYFFSKTITQPIGRLVDATKDIEEGIYELEMGRMPGDELGVLMRSFKEMGLGLAEREKMKDAFGKFVNKEIAEQVLKGEIKLGGERKTATVFFSDIRAFTAISEKLEPEEVVEFLNQYMTRMVNCVNETNGVVDKYIGDAIMAVWGVPVSHGNDTENAINGALMMRSELIEYNKGRGSEKKPIIKIGCGLNTGPVLAGQIGSEERMEYTVIGDTVNLASRIEALNKPFGTDILITEDTYKIVKKNFNVEPMKKIKVKGKAKPQQIYAVLGRNDDKKAPKTLAELRKLLGIKMKGKPKGAASEEEVKYEILD